MTRWQGTEDRQDADTRSRHRIRNHVQLTMS